MASRGRAVVDYIHKRLKMSVPSELTDDLILSEVFAEETGALACFFEDFSKHFGVRFPKVPNFNHYLVSLWRSRGIHVSDLGRAIFRVPLLDFSELTVGDLIEAAERSEWPAKLIYPPINRTSK